MAVTKATMLNWLKTCFGLVLLPLCLLSNMATAAVLPEDRADVLIHNYSGDGSTFKGPSILVRKQYKDKVSFWGNYYIDMNSSASIDVMTQGSPYEEERTEYSAGMDYLHDKTIMSVSFTNSSENDYEADTFAIGISQDFFGDLSTLTMSYAKGEDEVYQNIREGSGKDDITGRIFIGPASHQRFAIGWTQILTKSWIAALNAEASVDEGILRNPYRSVRYYQGADSINRQIENYPTTRSGQAYALKNMVYLPYRAALKLEYRVFSDSWDIEASNWELRYTHPYKESFIFDVRYRFYDQTQASFYSDIFAFQDEFDFMASDKELSTYQTAAIGFGVTYELEKKWIKWFDRGTLNFNFDYVSYNYDNFSNKLLTEGPNAADFDVNYGEEPMFEFNARISRLFLSLWY
ncbi:hypothetical protein TDB9533_01840 [Thalassocella blandensis]|nr:hypothetical protein TDB9533_01840 [Thalassocella blandensis]